MDNIKIRSIDNIKINTRSRDSNESGKHMSLNRTDRQLPKVGVGDPGSVASRRLQTATVIDALQQIKGGHLEFNEVLRPDGTPYKRTRVSSTPHPDLIGDRRREIISEIGTSGRQPAPKQSLERLRQPEASSKLVIPDGAKLALESHSPDSLAKILASESDLKGSLTKILNSESNFKNFLPKILTSESNAMDFLVKVLSSGSHSPDSLVKVISQTVELYGLHHEQQAFQWKEERKSSRERTQLDMVIKIAELNEARENHFAQERHYLAQERHQLAQERQRRLEFIVRILADIIKGLAGASTSSL